MRKIIIYSSFVIASLVVVVAFVTAKTYTQLAIAALLYPPLAYFAFKFFSRKTRKVSPAKPAATIQPISKPKGKDVDVVDIDKRTFLKLIGATGASVFLFSLLGKRVETSLLGSANNEVDATQSPTSGYKISEVDENDVFTYYGFINKDGAWLIMREDTETNSFRYAKGDSGFPGNWSKRENLKYDYFYNLF